MRNALVLLVALLASPVVAGETAWTELSPGVRARLISSDVRTGEQTTVALELDMPTNTRTYWRIPGESGIPPLLDWAGSSGIGSSTVLWPFPTIDDSAGYLDFAYFGPTVLPIALDVTGDSPVASLNATLGICSEVCVPAQVAFTLPLNFAKADPGNSIRINQALSTTPIAWDQPEPPFGDIALTDEGLAIALSDPRVDPSAVIADTADPAVLFGAPQKSPDNRSVLLPLLSGGSEALSGQPIRITFMTSLGPYEVTRQIAPASTESSN